MERHKAGEARVIPIILRPVSWEAAPFGKLQALPKDAIPVTSWKNQDEACVSVVRGIRGTVDELLNTLRAGDDTSRIIREVPANFQSSPPERVRGGDGGAVAYQTLVICFTDLQDSNSLTESIGHNSYLPHHLKDHFSVAETLTKLAGGDYVTNTNHGNIVLFKSGEQAINFALQLQEFYVERHCLIRRPLKLGVGLCFGQVQRIETGVLGSGAEQAAHVLSKAGAGSIIINTALFENLKEQWGAPKAGKYFAPLRQHEMKEISLHSIQELFSFEWQKFKNDYPEHSLANLVFQHLRQGKVEAPYVSIKDLSNSGVIIWPVVPRDVVNAIHRGQAEIIRLLVILGWKVHLLIADCGAPNNYEKADPIAFSEKLKKYIANRGIERIETSYLSDLFTPTSQDYDRIDRIQEIFRVQEIFRDIISDLTLQDFLNIVNKGYTDCVKDDILRRATLDCLRPVLSLAAVLYLAQKARQKSIIVAGADERRQWERAYDIPNTRDRIGVLMIPVLDEDNENHQRLLSKAGPIWSSQDSLIRDLSVSNTAWWTFHLHAFIPAFPATFVEISGNTMTPQEWHDPKQIPPKIRKEDLSQKVWTLLDPAS